MRGKEFPEGNNALRAGITPAGAGKRVRKRMMLAKSWDHPRMCGEKAVYRNGKAPRKGSPPHVRGKAALLDVVFRLTGITPACAGKSKIEGAGMELKEDHPRMCGEKPKK